MVRKAAAVLFAVLLGASITGCATSSKKGNMELEGLKNRVGQLETQLQEREQQVNELKDSLSKANDEKESLVKAQVSNNNVVAETKSRPTTRSYQIALKNAGYDPGAIDGHSGKKTREAIKSFQKEHKIKVDGKVGKDTWNLLKEYLSKKSK